MNACLGAGKTVGIETRSQQVLLFYCFCRQISLKRCLQTTLYSNVLYVTTIQHRYLPTGRVLLYQITILSIQAPVFYTRCSQGSHLANEVCCVLCVWCVSPHRTLGGAGKQNIRTHLFSRFRVIGNADWQTSRTASTPNEATAAPLYRGILGSSMACVNNSFCVARAARGHTVQNIYIHLVFV